MITPKIKLFTIAIFGHSRSLSYGQSSSRVSSTLELFGLFRNLKYRETSFIKKARQKENFWLKISGLPPLIKFNMATPQTTRFGCFCFLNYRQQLSLLFLPQNARRKQFQFFIWFLQKPQMRKSSIFRQKPKSRANPSQNIQYGHPHIKLFRTASFGIFSSLSYGHGQTP